MSHFYLLAINKKGLRTFNKGVEGGNKMDSSDNSLVVKNKIASSKKEDGNMDSFARNLVELRKKAGLTQEELAAKLGLSAQSISKYETGAANPDISYLPGIADALGVTIDRLFGRETVGFEEGRKPKKILVRVNSEDGDKVNLNLPYRAAKFLLKAGLKFGGNDAMKNIDVDAIFEAAEQGCFGPIVDINSSDGDIVQIIIE